MPSSNLKGINIQLGAETTGLDKALAGVNKSAKDAQIELRQVEKLLKMDPGNTTLLAQKQELLTKSIEATKDKLQQLKAAQEQVEAQFKSGQIGEAQYRAFQREIAKTEQDLKRLGDQGKETGKELANGLDGASAKFDDLAVKAAAAGTAMVMAANRAQQALKGMTTGAQETVSQIVALQRMTGLSAEEASKMVYVFQRYGIESKSAGTWIKTLSKAINDHSQELEAAGIATQNADGSNRTSMEVMADLAEYYSKASDKTQAVSLASKVLGKNWQALLPVLSGGKKSLQDLAAAAEENNAVFSQEQLDAVKALTAAEKDLAQTTKALADSIGIASAPMETWKTQVLQGILETLNKLNPTLASVLVGIAVVGLEIVKLAGYTLAALAGIKFALPGLFSWISTSLGPAISGVFSGIISAFSTFFGATLPGFFAGLPALLGTFAAWVASLTGAAAGAALAIAVGLGVALGAGINALLQSIPGYQEGWNKLLQPLFDWFDTLPAWFAGVGMFFAQSWANIGADTKKQWDSIVASIGSAFSGFSTLGSQIVAGIRKGIVDSWAGLKTQFFALLSQLPQWAKNILGIASPSKVFAEIGKNMTLGMEVGLKVGIPDVEALMADLTAKVAATAARASAINVNMGIANPGAYGARGAGGSGGYSGPLVAQGAVQITINGNVARGEGDSIALQINRALGNLAREVGRF